MMDIFTSLIGLLLLAPLLGCIAILIKLESPGPIIFKQNRVGLNEKVFVIYKFRTMINNAIAQGLGLATSSTDVRVTRLGWFLREYHLDELPQLFNVLIGDMSLVGPRPTLPQQIERYTERQRKRHSVRPGITGLAQVRGNNELDWDQRIEFDLQYIENCSISNDLKIIKETFIAVIKRQGIYGENGLVHDKK